MKIDVVFTGGTIGSRIDERGFLSTREEAPYQLIEAYEKRFATGICFETEEPYCTLSENLRAQHIEKLVSVLQQRLRKRDVDGIIVTHGTDTLAYTAAMLGYLLGDSPVPIVLVSSNYVLTDPRANGISNFAYAVEFIRQQGGNGVFVSYRNTGDVPRIHRGTRLQPPIPYSDAVDSVLHSFYGSFEGECYRANPLYRAVPGQASIPIPEGGFRLQERSDAIVRVVPYVGMRYPVLPDACRVVLMESFHSGTICVDAELERFVKQAGMRGIPLYLTGLNTQEHAYETVDVYRGYGILPLPMGSSIAQYCKMWICTSNGLDLQWILQHAFAEDIVQII